MLKIIATIGAIQILAIAVTFIRSKTIAVLLGPEGVGIISVVDQIIQLIAQLSAFSLPFAAVKFLSRTHSEGFEAFKRSYGNLLRLLLLLTTTGAAIALAVVFWHPELLGSHLLNYRMLLVIGIVSIPAITLLGFLKNVLAAAQQVKASALMDVAIAIALTTAACIGISIAGVLGFYWGNLLGVCLVVIATLTFLKKKLHLPLLSGDRDIWKELRQNPDIVTFASILYVSAFLYPLAYFAARYAVLKGFGEAEAGLLQAAIAMSSVLNLVLNPANGLYLTPILNRDIPKAEKLQAALEFQGKLAIALGVLAMPMVLFSQWLLVLLFSPSFVQVSRVVFLFIIAQCIIQLAGVYQALIIGLDDLKIYGVIVATGHLSFGLVSWIVAPQYGIFGVAIGLLVSSVTIFLLTLAQLFLRHGLILPPKLSYSMAYGLLMLFLSGSLFNQYDTWHPLVIFSKFALYVLFLISLLFLLSRNERQQLVQQGEMLLLRAKRSKGNVQKSHWLRR